jgi:UDPglucose 6-dehydrogenase
MNKGSFLTFDNKKEKKMEKMRIGLIGVGMVGTPLKRWFFEKGWERGKNLFCYDADPKKGFYDDVSCASVVFICVPTPPNPDGSCNASIVESVVAQLPDRERCVVIKSTVPPGTTAALRKKYKSKGYFLFNPEFLTEAQAWEDFIRPDRQIVAAADEDSRKWISVVLNLLPIGSFQSPGVDGTYNFHEVNSTEAELAKYAGNNFGALKVAFFNNLCDRCQLLGANYENVRMLVTHDRRIGGAWTDVNHGGFRGYAGFCFPKDSDATIAHDEELLKTLKEKNDGFAEVFEKGLNLLKAKREYNKTLLGFQGRTVEELSVHDKQVKKKIKTRKRRKNK